MIAYDHNKENWQQKMYVAINLQLSIAEITIKVLGSLTKTYS